MPKRTLLLIIIIGTITILLVVAAFLQMRNAPKPTGIPTQEPPTQTISRTEVPKTASLSFSPSNIDTNSAVYKSDIIVDTGGSPITGVQAELQYDPARITNVSILPPVVNGIFGKSGQILINEIRQDVGRISYAVVINVDAEQVRGIGSIATIQFSLVSTAIPSPSEITFLEKSIVTSLGTNSSLLKGSSPLIISIPQSTPAIQQFTTPIPTQIPLQ